MQAGLSLCWLHITHCWKSHATAHFMINLHGSMGPGWNRTRDPWICSQTHICSQTNCATRPGVNDSVISPFSGTCLAVDASLTADPGVARSIPARSRTFMEIDYEITSTVILLPSVESFKKDCCQLSAKVCGRSTG